MKFSSQWKSMQENQEEIQSISSENMYRKEILERERECHAIGMKVFLEIHEGTREGQDDEQEGEELKGGRDQLFLLCVYHFLLSLFSSHSSPLSLSSFCMLGFRMMMILIVLPLDLPCFSLSLLFPCLFILSFLPHANRTRGQHKIYKKHNKNVHVTCMSCALNCLLSFH